MVMIHSEPIELQTFVLDPQHTFVFVVEKRMKTRIRDRVFISEQRIGIYFHEKDARKVCTSLNKERCVGEVEYKVIAERLRGMML